jgi:hypothetical protein
MSDMHQDHADLIEAQGAYGEMEDRMEWEREYSQYLDDLYAKERKRRFEGGTKERF